MWGFLYRSVMFIFSVKWCWVRTGVCVFLLHDSVPLWKGLVKGFGKPCPGLCLTQTVPGRARFVTDESLGFTSAVCKTHSGEQSRSNSQYFTGISGFKTALVIQASTALSVYLFLWPLCRGLWGVELWGKVSCSHRPTAMGLWVRLCSPGPEEGPFLWPTTPLVMKTALLGGSLTLSPLCWLAPSKWKGSTTMALEGWGNRGREIATHIALTCNSSGTFLFSPRL